MIPGCIKLATALLLVIATCDFCRTESGTLDSLREELTQLEQAEKYAEALPVAEQALTLAESRLGATNPELVSLIGKVASLQTRLGDEEKAEQLYRRALAIREAAFGIEDTLTAQALQDLANSLARQDRHDDAEPLWRRALAIRERTLGDHRDTAYTLNQLGWALEEQYNYRDAEPVFRRALSMREQVLGAEHLQTLFSLQQLANNLHKQGRYGDAAPYYARLLALQSKTLDPDSLTLAATLTYVGNNFYWQEQYPDAEPLYKRALAIRQKVLGAEHLTVAQSLINLANLYYYWDNRYADAEPFYREALAIQEKVLGRNDLSVARTLTDLGDLYYYWNNRYEDAERFYREALAIREAVLGLEATLTARSLQDIGDTLASLGRHVEAETFSQRALTIREKALGDHADTAYSLNQLAWSLEEQGRLGEAEPLLRRALAIREQVLGPEHKSTLFSLGRLADNLERSGAFPEAEPLYQRVIEARERLLGSDDPGLANVLTGFAVLRAWQGRFKDAEEALRRALAIREKNTGPDAPEVATVLSRLGQVYGWEGRDHDAELALKRALSIREKKLGPNHVLVGESLYELAALLVRQNNSASAMYYQRAFEIFEKSLGLQALAIREKLLGPYHPELPYVLDQLGELYFWWRGASAAEPFFARSLAIVQKLFGDEHIYAATSYERLARVYRAQGRFADADELFKRAEAIYEKLLGSEHQWVSSALNYRAGMALEQRDLAGAAALWQKSSDVLIHRWRRDADVLGRAVTGKIKSVTERSNARFYNLIKTSHRLSTWQAEHSGELAASMFWYAQWAIGSEAASSLAQMAARSTGGAGTLGRLVRERQDLVGEWQEKDQQLTRLRSEAPGKRDLVFEQSASARLAAIDARIAEIDRKFASDFPEYAALSNPEPLGIADVQAALGEQEVLVFLLPTSRWNPLPEETFIWAITKTEARWLRSDFGSDALKKRVDTLRCGLDRTNWDDTSKWRREDSEVLQAAKTQQIARLARCEELTGRKRQAQTNGALLPFDFTTAHELYVALFGEIEDLIAHRNVLIATSGPLNVLPLNVLLSKAPPCEELTSQCLGRMQWFGIGDSVRSISVLPAVSSLASLRGREAKALRQSRASKPYIGFANPLLTGRQQDQASARVAARWQNCSNVNLNACSDRFPGSISGPPLRASRLNEWSPIPQTACEVCSIAHKLKVPRQEIDQEILLGHRLREMQIKRLGALSPVTGRSALQDYRILHFATHGAVVDAVWQFKEPGLILTPPGDDEQSADDDGYLAASEVAQLHLDADWVILSACNTAAGTVSDKEALSGLASAFFYAGARAILVSHWAVSTNAAVDLTTRAVSEMTSQGGTGRAEALRAAINGLLDEARLAVDEHTRALRLHPSFWGAFVLVGEGAQGHLSTNQ